MMMESPRRLDRHVEETASSPATAPEIPLTWLETASVFPQRGRDDAAQRR